MNESMLHSLMHLFAIIAGINRETVLVLARSFVKSFLEQELSTKLAKKYLAIFDYYYTEIEAPETKQGEDGTSEFSKKIAVICGEINQELHIGNKFRILLSLLQFMKYFESTSPGESGFSQRVSESVKAISKGLKIGDREFDNCRAFVTDKFYKVPDRDSVLVVSDEASIRLTEIKHLQKEHLNGQILVMQIRRAESYLFYYTGKERIELNGKYVFPRHVYFLPKGSSIRSASITPIYYSDISSSFHQSASADRISLVAEGISYRFPGSDNGIRELSLTGDSGQLVGIMGGSGTGKSTLVKLLNGSLKPETGTIRINGTDLYGERKPEGLIGNIPQDDLLIEELTVYQNLYYNARLCLADLTEEEVTGSVDRMLQELDLFEIRHLKVGSPLNKFISGGQRKRLNIALELIRSPYILFVDEPTSGLSSTDSEHVMYLLKEQAVKGKLIMAVIHQPSSGIFKMFDRLLVLDRGGYPIYQGDPVEALRYFKEATERVDSAENDCPTCGNVDTEEILQIVEARGVDEQGEYTRERRTKPREWYNLYKKNIEAGLHPPDAAGEIPAIDFRRPGLAGQFRIFFIRNMLSKIADRQYLLIALLVVPLLALILGYFTKYVSGEAGDPHKYVFSRNDNLPAYLFMSVIVALFFGMIMAAEEIIKDRKILQRESFLNLSRTSYLASKVSFLFLLSAFQMIAFVLIGNYILRIKGLTATYWLILFSTSCLANLAGLNISDALKSVVAIYIVVPFLLIPQILLAGVIVKFDKLHYSVASNRYVPMVGELMASRWAYEALAVDQFRYNDYQRSFFDIEQKESNVAYNMQQIIPLVRERISDLDGLESVNTGTGAAGMERSAERTRLLGLIRSGLEPFNERIPLDVYDSLSPGGYNENIGREVYGYLDMIQERLSAVLDQCKAQESKIIEAKEKELGGLDGLVAQKKACYNESLADLVLNRSELKKVGEAGGKFIRKTEPIYQVSASRIGRAHFFAAYKRLGELTIDTVTYNVAVIWIMTLFLCLALRFRWLDRILAWFDRKF